jgi:hypothetical protein
MEETEDAFQDNQEDATDLPQAGRLPLSACESIVAQNVEVLQGRAAVVG